MHKVYIGLGANLGQRLLTLRSAFEAMKNIPSTFNCQISKVYESIPEHNAGPDFLNAVASAETELEPQRLLEYLLSLEHEFARRKHEDRSRELDLDLLDYDGEILEKQSPDLILPHPRLHLRWFVLKPMCDIDTNWMHPVLNKTALELLADTDNEGREFNGCI
ncbi:MAG: 2-amino-4-hydroxy-6-hydroxymethyldihydropteridine diphosphokinase [Candidatus Heimdallarchaeota archaeon]|nr:2-amino-4-hydroxy-6-hydroxymethyldihydropteridine diphosphokinase [Candidatus Heimdallarchaeota archaeon]